MKKILLTGFRGTSSELLVKKMNCEYLILPNDKVLDSQIVLAELALHSCQYLFCFGQKPNIRDKVYLETAARNGNRCLYTDFAYDKLQDALRAEKLEVRIMRVHLFVMLYTGMCWSISKTGRREKSVSSCTFRSARI